jgi:hypothetical protein
MKDTQKLSPKYWVVHDTTTDDVFIDTAKKGKENSIDAFIYHYGFKTFGILKDYDAREAFDNQTRYECILIEILHVKLGD